VKGTVQNVAYYTWHPYVEAFKDARKKWYLIPLVGGNNLNLAAN